MNNSKKKKIYRMEQQDAQGISRKKVRHALGLKELYALKITIIALIIVFYFVYSPLLIFLMLAYAFLFFLSVKTEKAINKSFLKKNYIKIPRFDHALALIVVVVAIVAVLAGATTKTQTGSFDGMSSSQVEQYLENDDMDGAKDYVQSENVKEKIADMFSLLTGERNAFGNTNNFGMQQAPGDFEAPDGEMPELPEGESPGDDFDADDFRQGNLGFKEFGMRASDLPVYYLFSSVLATVASVIIFSVPAVGIAEMVYVALKKRKTEKQTYTAIITSSSITFSEEELDKILSYGEDVEYVFQQDDYVSDEELSVSDSESIESDEKPYITDKETCDGGDNSDIESDKIAEYTQESAVEQNSDALNSDDAESQPSFQDDSDED